MGRSLPNETVICASVDQQPFSDYEANKISDNSSNVNPTSVNTCVDEFSIVENSRIAFSKPICCLSSNKIDSNKSIISNEHKQPIHYLDVIGKNQNKRQNRRLSPTHFHQTECECASRKSHENPTAKSCHIEHRKFIKVGHKLNNDITHSITDQSWIDTNKVNASDIQINKQKINCLDYDYSDQCCFCCYSDCKKGSRLKTNYKCDDQSVEHFPLQSPTNFYYNGANDIHFHTHLNNNCKFYKNQNNDQNSFCKSDITTETDIFDTKNCLVHNNSNRSTQFYIDYAAHSEKSSKHNKRKTDPILPSNQPNYLRRTQSVNENCSDCIDQLDKEFIKNVKRLQSADCCPIVQSNYIENVPIVQTEHQKLVCCSKNVTAVRKTATLFMIGSDSTAIVGSKSKLNDKSELVHDDLVGTCQISTNNKNHKTQYNKCNEYKSIDSKNQLTSILPAKESHSKNSVRNQIINYKIRGDRTHKHSNENQHLNSDKKQRKHNDSFGNEGVNGDNDEYLCHLEKLNLANTNVGSATSEQVKQKVAHIFSTYRDNNGATTTHTSAASTLLTVENELIAVDKSKQNEYNVSECTDQSATTPNHSCKLIEHNQNDVQFVKSIKSDLNTSDNEDTDYCSNENLLHDKNSVLSANTEKITNEECMLFEHKPILSSAINRNRLFNRRASFDNSVENDFAIFVNHRRTNSSGGEGFSFDRQSKLNRSYIDSISDRFRYVQNIDHRYAHYLTPNTVSSNNTNNLFYRKYKKKSSN